MPEQVAGQSTSEWTQESVEKQATEIEKVAPAQAAETEQLTESAEPEAKEKKDRDHYDNLVSAATEARAQKREAIARAAAMEQQNAQLVRQMQELIGAVNQRGQTAQVPAPDDVLGQMQYGIHQTQAQVQQLTQAQQQQYMRQQQEMQAQQFVSAVRNAEAEFVKKQPDASEAINFLKSSRVEEYKAAGLTHQMAVQQMINDEQQLVVWAMQNGENPAEAAFQMAVKRGYVASKQKLAMQQEGQRASMPSGSGGKGGGQPTLEALLKMDAAAFTEATAGDNWARLMKKHM